MQLITQVEGADHTLPRLTTVGLCGPWGSKMMYWVQSAWSESGKAWYAAALKVCVTSLSGFGCRLRSWPPPSRSSLVSSSLAGALKDPRRKKKQPSKSGGSYKKKKLKQIWWFRQPWSQLIPSHASKAQLRREKPRCLLSSSIKIVSHCANTRIKPWSLWEQWQ